MSRWERREQKLRKRRNAMRMAGAGLKKVILPLLQKKTELTEARAAEKNRRPKSSFKQCGLDPLTTNLLRLAWNDPCCLYSVIRLSFL